MKNSPKKKPLHKITAEELGQLFLEALMATELNE